MVGLSIPRSASSQGPRAPADWPDPSISPTGASTSTVTDASVNPPPRNESREPIPAVNQIQISPTRLRAPPVVPLHQLHKLGPPPASRAPPPPSNKAPYQIPQFIQASTSNSNNSNTAAAHAQSQRQQNEYSVAEQGMNRSEASSADTYRRPSISTNQSFTHTYVPQTPSHRLQTSLPNGTISITTNVPSQSRPNAFSARSPNSPHRLIGARSHDNLRGARGVRPLPHGPTPLSTSFNNRMAGVTASPVQMNALSQRQYPPSPSSSGSPVGPIPSSFGNLSRGGPAAGDRPLPGILGAPTSGSRRPNATDSNPQGTSLQRVGAISGPRYAAPGRFGNTAGGSVAETRGEAVPATGPATTSAAAVAAAGNSGSDVAARGLDMVAAPLNITAHSQVMMRTGSGPPAGSALGSTGFHAHSGSLSSQMSPVPSSTLLGSGSAPHSPSRSERPQLPQLYVPPELPLTSRDSEGEPISAASLAHITAERRRSLELRHSAAQPNNELTVLSTEHWLAPIISEGTLLPGQSLLIPQSLSDDLEAGSPRSSGSNTPKSHHEVQDSGTNLSFGSSTAGDDDSSDSDSSSEDLWQGARLTPNRNQDSQGDSKFKPNLEPIKTTFQRQDDAWVIRPGPEVLYDHIDKFFPKVNLDEPVIESTPSPTSAEISVIYPPMSPTTAAQLPSPEPVSHDRNHRKSIRVVANERSHKLKHLLKANFGSKNDSKALGRRMTKFWGSRVEELPPHPKSRIEARSPDTASSPTPPERPGPVTFKWVRGDLIGKGSYGRVYHALNATTGEIMAVKQVELPKTISDHDDKRQLTVVSALKSESATLSTLDHPHVVQYLGFEETPEFLSMCVDFVQMVFMPYLIHPYL